MLAHLLRLESKVDLLQAEMAEARADLAAVADRLEGLPTKADLDSLKLRWAAIGLMAGVILVVGAVGVVLLS